MKLCLYSASPIPGLPIGKHNLKDSRLDQADRLVEAKKKVYVQLDLLDAENLADAEAVLVPADQKADLILRDLEYIETRLSRTPAEPERSALLKLQQALESEQLVSQADLEETERQAIVVHAFVTAKPICVASADEFERPDDLLLRVYREAGFISFLTLGGKENRAWRLRRGCTAFDAAGVIHTDMQKGFIRAEIIGWDDFLAHDGETGAKRAGKLRLETKTYVMQDCDVAHFRFNK